MTEVGIILKVTSFHNKTSQTTIFKHKNSTSHSYNLNLLDDQKFTDISSFIFLFFIKFYLFILRERLSRQGAQRGREKIPSRLCTVSREPDMGFELTNCEIMT